MKDISKILIERGERYGDFMSHASVTQNIKRILKDAIACNKRYFYTDQVEALEMIAHKIGRIVNGDPHYVDSWDDIAGYAKLVSDRIREGDNFREKDNGDKKL